MRNSSGIYPCGDRVLVKPDPIKKEDDGTLIEIPDEVRRRYEQGQATGTLVAVGPDAFTHSVETHYHIHGNGAFEAFERRVSGYSEPFARAGDRVAYARFTGAFVTGEDGVNYILLNDEDITAKVSDNVEFSQLIKRNPVGLSQ